MTKESEAIKNLKNPKPTPRLPRLNEYDHKPGTTRESGHGLTVTEGSEKSDRPDVLKKAMKRSKKVKTTVSQKVAGKVVEVTVTNIESVEKKSK